MHRRPLPVLKVFATFPICLAACLFLMGCGPNGWGRPAETPVAIQKEAQIDQFDFSSAPLIETQEAYESLAVNAISGHSPTVCFMTRDERFCLLTGGSVFADQYGVRACVPYVWQTDGGLYYVAYELYYYMGETVASAYLQGDPSGLDEEERAVYDWAANFLANMDETLSDYEKLLVLHDTICQATTYATVDLNDNSLYAETSPYGLLFLGKANCQGYADTFKMLANMCGIQAQIVGGTADGGQHVWNQVLLNGDWGFIDTTFDDGFFSGGQLPAHVYFFPPMELFKRTHSWDETRSRASKGLIPFYYEYKSLSFKSPPSEAPESDFLLACGPAEAEQMLRSLQGTPYLRGFGPYTACLVEKQ